MDPEQHLYVVEIRAEFTIAFRGTPEAFAAQTKQGLGEEAERIAQTLIHSDLPGATVKIDYLNGPGSDTRYWRPEEIALAEQDAASGGYSTPPSGFAAEVTLLDPENHASAKHVARAAAREAQGE